jgi:putative tricarboxylic transport membrane protein
MTGGMTGARSAWGELAIALGVIILGVVAYWQTLAIPVSPLYAKVGPTVMPMMAAGGLVVLGIALLVSALRGGWQTQDEREVEPDRPALMWVTAGLILNVVLIGPAGFSLASTALFVCVSRGFGSRSPFRDAGIGLALALAAYVGFAKTLGINIGAGLIENALDTFIFHSKAP